MLFAAAHILLNLWTISTLDAVAHDAARDVAIAIGGDLDRNELEARARQRAIAALGTYGRRVEIRFVDAGPDRVSVVASGPSLSVLPRPFAEGIGLDRLERRATVRVEDAS